MSTQDIEIVRSLYDAFARRDLDTIRSALAPDVVIQEPEALPWGGRYTGPDGFTTFISALLRRVEPALDVEELVDAGDHVVCIGRSRGRVLANDQKYDVREVHVWSLRDGLVASLAVYLDMAILAALAPE